MSHPSKDLKVRNLGFGIAAGFEKSYSENNLSSDLNEQYGSIPHSGYYGVGVGERPFKKGQASFTDELNWYRDQYGEKTVSK